MYILTFPIDQLCLLSVTLTLNSLTTIFNPVPTPDEHDLIDIYSAVTQPMLPVPPLANITNERSSNLLSVLSNAKRSFIFLLLLPRLVRSTAQVVSIFIYHISLAL